MFSITFVRIADVNKRLETMRKLGRTVDRDRRTLILIGMLANNKTRNGLLKVKRYTDRDVLKGISMFTIYKLDGDKLYRIVENWSKQDLTNKKTAGFRTMNSAIKTINKWEVQNA